MSGATWLRIAAIMGFLSVAFGAFGAHGLQATLKVEESDSFEVRTRKLRFQENFETAAKYQMYHALALAFVGIVAAHGKPGGLLTLAGWSFVGGIVLFSGSLYALVLTGQRWLGAITPLGGLLFLAGWLAFAFSVPTGSKPSAEL